MTKGKPQHRKVQVWGEQRNQDQGEEASYETGAQLSPAERRRGARACGSREMGRDRDRERQ